MLFMMFIIKACLISIILNNLLIQEQQAKNREGIIRAAQQDQLRKADLTGFDDDGFGIPCDAPLDLDGLLKYKSNVEKTM